MQQPKHSLLLLGMAGVGFAGLGVLFGILVSNARSADNSQPVFDFSEEATLGGGISFTEPEEAELLVVSVTADDARAAASRVLGEEPKAIEVKVARVRDRYRSPEFSCLCWVVSLDTTQYDDLIVGYGRTDEDGNALPLRRFAHSVVVVDAISGKALFQRSFGSVSVEGEPE